MKSCPTKPGLALLLVALTPAFAAAQVHVSSWHEATSLAGTWRYRVGDDPNWAAAELDDTGWTTTEVPDRETPPADTLGQPVVWYRLHVTLSEAARERLVTEPRPLAVSLGWESATADVVYVDGQRIGVDGRVAPTPRPSAPWPSVHAVPSELLHDGEAVIAVRAWMHPYFDGVVGSFSDRMNGEPWLLGPRGAVEQAVTEARHTNRVARLEQNNLLSIVLLAVVALAFFLLWALHRPRLEHLTFAVFATCGALDSLVYYLWKQDAFDASVAFPVTVVISVIANVVALETLWRMFGEGRAPRWFRVAQLVVPALRLVALLPFGYELLFRTRYAFVGVLAFLVIILVVLTRAIRARREGARVALVGFTLTVLMFFYAQLSWLQVLPRIPFFRVFTTATIVFTMAAALAVRFTAALERIQATSAAVRRFVPAAFLAHLGKEDVLEVHRGEATAREMTVLFADIRGFTGLSEKLGPEQTFAFMNDYHALMGPVIAERGGFINQYYGDGIMALFDEADGAVEAAREMLAALETFNEGHEPIAIGIGLHTGEVMLGTIGDERRLDTGVIGDAVNTASRIQELTKAHGRALLLSEATRDALEDDAKLEEVATVTPRGKSEAITLWSLR